MIGRRQARMAEDFAAALDERGPFTAPRDPSLAPLLGLARGLQALPLGPAPDFRDALRARLVAVASVAAPVAPPTAWERFEEWIRTWRAQRVLGATAGATAAVVAVTGVGTAASRSIPGDPFYGVKRTTEALQITFARSELNEGKRHLQHAETRLDEIARLAGSDVALAPVGGAEGAPTALALGGSRAGRIVETLRAMDDDTRAGTRLLTRVYNSHRDSAPLEAIARFASRQQTGLRQVIGSLPTPARDEAQASLDLVETVATEAQDLLDVVAPAPTPVPTMTATPAPSLTPTVAPTPTPTPGPSSPAPCAPCDLPTPEPTGTPEPTPEPTDSPSPEPTESPDPTESPSPSSSPSPSPSPTGVVPSIVPSPVRSPVEEIVEDAGKALPSATPTASPPIP